MALTRAWTPHRPHAVQRALWTTNARFVACAAGRRAGKTDIALRYLVRHLPWKSPLTANTRYFYGGPTHKQAHRVAWDRLIAFIPREWIPKNGIHESDLRIRTIFGSELWVVGLDKPQRMEGDPWDGCVIDESSDIKPKTFDRSIRPSLSDRQGWCWRIGVPKRFGCGAAEYRDFYEKCAKGEYPQGAAFTWPASDILDPAECKHARETLDVKDYREQYDARWETAGGQIFYSMDFDCNVRACNYDPTRPLVIGSDFNVDPMAWTISHVVSEYGECKQLETFDELWLRDSNTNRALDVLWQRYGQHHQSTFEFYGDASSAARKTSASTTDYAQILNDKRFRDKGAVVRYPRTNPRVVERFACCNALLLNAAGERRWFIDPRCINLLNDLRNRAYKEGSREPDDFGDTGHITDAAGYVVHKLFPIRVAVTTQPRIHITG